MCSEQKDAPKSEDKPTPEQKKKSRLHWLANFMGVAEFLAREVHSETSTPSTTESTSDAQA
jgi:hypothetical protein